MAGCWAVGWLGWWCSQTLRQQSHGVRWEGSDVRPRFWSRGLGDSPGNGSGSGAVGLKRPWGNDQPEEWWMGCEKGQVEGASRAEDDWQTSGLGPGGRVTVARLSQATIWLCPFCPENADGSLPVVLLLPGPVRSPLSPAPVTCLLWSAAPPLPPASCLVNDKF